MMGRTTTYIVEGMTCAHCVTSVIEEVGENPAVTGVDVDLTSGRMTVTTEIAVDDAVIAAAVTEAGFVLSGRAPEGP